MYDQLPKTLRIFGHDWKVIVWTKKQYKKKDLMGQCVHAKEILYVAPGLSDVALCNTLLHEIQHANFWMMTMDEAENKEEVIINNLTNAMIAALRDNQDLLTFVFTALQDKKPDPEPEQEPLRYTPVTPLSSWLPMDSLSSGYEKIINAQGKEIPMYKGTDNV